MTDKETPEHKKIPNVVNLLYDLQKSLATEQVIKIFANYLQQELNICGIQYSCPAYNLVIDIGSKRKNITQFNLDNQGANLGDLLIYSNKKLSIAHQEIISNIIKYLNYPLKNSFAYATAMQKSLEDPLTSIGNRRALEKSLMQVIQESHRYHSNMTVLLLDIDKFKTINDLFGHATGDKLLCKVVHSIISCVRSADIVFRYGGDEFVVLLHRTNYIGGVMIADRIKQCAIKSMVEINKKIPGDKQPAAISIGVAAMFPCDSIEQLFSRADRALYRDKQDSVLTQPSPGPHPGPFRAPPSPKIGRGG